MFDLFAPALAALTHGDIGAVAVACACLWVFGAVVASFSGLVATRLGHVQEGESVLRAISYPPSHCDGCGRCLNAIDLVPVVGWVVAGGRCKCGGQISALYPAAEMSIGIASAAIPLLVGFNYTAICLIGILWAGVLASWIDFVEHIIPEEITWPLLFLGLLVSPFEHDPWARAAGAAVCCGAMWASLAAVGWLRGIDTRAGGDVALAAAAGAWLGVEGTAAFLLLSSVVFVSYSIPSRLRGDIWVPMGPALCCGLLATAMAKHAEILPF